MADLVELLSTITATLSIVGAVAFFMFRSWRSYTTRSLFGRWASFHYTYDEGKKELIESKWKVSFGIRRPLRVTMLHAKDLKYSGHGRWSNAGTLHVHLVAVHGREDAVEVLLRKLAAPGSPEFRGAALSVDFPGHIMTTSFYLVRPNKKKSRSDAMLQLDRMEPVGNGLMRYSE